jgi:hypothetical protein
MLTYAWGNQEQTVVKVGGIGLWIPADEANADFAALLANGVEIQPFAGTVIEAPEPQPQPQPKPGEAVDLEPWEEELFARNGLMPEVSDGVR